jgi:PAS domain S-box-containing protein
MDLPGCWNGYLLNGKKLSGDGYATYRLKVLMKDQKGNLAFGPLDISSAFTVYANGEKVSFAGISGKNFETTIPNFFTRVSEFASDTNQIEIILQISNYHHRLGGPWEVIRLGREKEIRENRERSLVFDMFLCGSILLIGIYHLCLFFLRRKDRSPLYFSSLCFLIVLRILTTGERYFVNLLPGVDWEVILKIEYLSFYLAVPFFAMFIHSLFYQEFSQRVLRIVQLFGIIFPCIVLLTPVRIYSHTLQTYQIITLLASTYGMYVLVRSLVRKRDGALVFAIGFVVFLLTVVNDILYSRMVTQFGYFTPFGLFSFILFQALLLSRRFSKAFNIIEKQGEELNERNRVYVKEINDRKRIETALQEAYSIINRSPAVAFLWKNSEGWPVEFVSDNVTELFGYAPEEFTSGQIFYSMTIHPDDLERVAKEVTTFSQDNEKKSFVHEPYRIVSKDKKVRWVDDRTYMRRDAQGDISHYEGIVVDITDSVQAAQALRENKEKLARSKKMESLGLLVGGVAHDLNNVLSGIVSYPELLLMNLPQDSKLRKPIETIRESGHRAAAIVQDLLTVARGVATTKKPLNLNNIIIDYLHSAEFGMLKQFHPTITFKTELDPNLLNITGSYEHIRKVVMNLVSNAAEAITGRGNVTIKTMNQYMDRPLSGYDDVDVGEYVLLCVSDDGSGISAEGLERIFEAFYTKKVMGRSGTGLGLSVVWNTVQDHHGYVDVKSEENGATFDLYFPITRDEIADEGLSIPIEDYKGDGEAILVVDDVENQRDIACKMLDKLGYKSKAVSSGEEAVQYVKENAVDLLLLDMIMDPGINGRETYERIIKIRSGQKAIISSGFAETDDVKAAQQMGAGKYIKKPITLEMLGLAVKEELEK